MQEGDYERRGRRRRLGGGRGNRREGGAFCIGRRTLFRRGGGDVFALSSLFSRGDRRLLSVWALGKGECVGAVGGEFLEGVRNIITRLSIDTFSHLFFLAPFLTPGVAPPSSHKKQLQNNITTR